MTDPIDPSLGPVAVTGATGFIGSHIVRTLARRGYEVRACVRDPANHGATAHLSAIDREGPGRVSLHACDMMVPGAYDDVFSGCSAVFHAAAEMGNLEGSTPLKVYEGGLLATQRLVDSLLKTGSVRRLIYTSSFAAVAHPADDGYRFTEASWADMNQERRRPGAEWTLETVHHSREVAYAMTKVESERFVYAQADKHGFAAFGVCPCHVIGPLLSASHQRPWSWQTRIGDMLEGFGHPRMFWNIVDVRDVAEAQVRAAESPDNRSGDRYNLVAADESGLIPQGELQAMLRRFYPGFGIAGDHREGPVLRTQVATLEKAATQLGLTPRPVEETVRDNADSLIAWSLVKMRPSEDNWQRERRDLGIKSKWSPHEYPASDPTRLKAV